MVNNIKSRNLTQQRDNSSQENDYIREDNERKKSKKPIGIHAHKKGISSVGKGYKLIHLTVKNQKYSLKIVKVFFCNFYSQFHNSYDTVFS